MPHARLCLWVGLGTLASLLAAGATNAQPVHWEQRLPSGWSTGLVPTISLASAPSGRTYVAPRGWGAYAINVAALDASGTLTWMRALTSDSPLWTERPRLAADDLGVMSAVTTAQPVPPIPRGGYCCFKGRLERLAAVDGASSGTLFAVDEGAILDVAALPGGVVVVGNRRSAAGAPEVRGYVARRGDVSWTADSGTSHPFVVAVFADGASVVATRDQAGQADFLQRHAADGTLQWSRAAQCVRVAAARNGDAACASDTHVQRFDPSGNAVGPLIAFGDPAWDRVLAIAFDDDGGLWVAGSEGYAPLLPRTAMLSRFDVAGTRTAHVRLDDTGRSSAWNALAIAPGGGVYVAGWIAAASTLPALPGSMIAARYDAAGVRRWFVERANAPSAIEAAATDAIAAGDGVVVAGYERDSTLAWSMVAVKYGADPVAAPSATWSVQPAPPIAGQPLQLRLTLAGSPPPAGTVTFGDGVAVLCAAVPLVATAPAQSSATCATRAPVHGLHGYTATYSGDASNAPATYHTLVTVAADASVGIPALGPAALASLACVLALAGALGLRRA